MTKTALLKHVETLLDEAERTRAYGTIEIEYRAGKLTFLTKTEQQKLDETENRYGQQIFCR